MKKLIPLITIITLAGCVAGPNLDTQKPLENPTDNTVPTNDTTPPPATETVLPDGTTQDADGFVRFPGEPSREDKSYYIVEDVCGQFTKQFIEEISGKTIIKMVPFTDNSTTYNCDYYTSDTDYFSLHLTYLTIENQKTGQEALGRTVSSNSNIPKENYIVTQEDGLINEIYLVLSPNKYLSIIRSSAQSLSETEVVDFATKLGEKIKEFK